MANSAPPPSDSKPEAANFPTQIYDMSSETTLFQPPSHYPEAPKDMWYQVPEKVPEPEKPKQIFPWESRAPKPTRVFAQPKAPSPPLPEPTIVVEQPEEATTPSAATEESVSTPPPPMDTWAAFQQRTNAWDDMPEIERYIQSISQPRKAKIQVLHHSPSQRSPRSSNVTSPPARTDRRPSMKLTDFPTADERPSLPVTPAPIRRPTIWGVEKDEEGILPTAEGVPKQEDWVRRFSSYPKPAFPDLPPPLHNLRGVLYWRCQFCGKQNPVARLEELQKRQSEVLTSPTGTRELGDAEEPPSRKMPESSSKEEAVEATIQSISPTKMPKMPKPILKAPHFELGKTEEDATAQDNEKKEKEEDEPDPRSKTETATEVVSPGAPVKSVVAPMNA